MKKVMFAVTMMFALSAHAETVIISESNDGATRVTADTSTLIIDDYQAAPGVVRSRIHVDLIEYTGGSTLAHTAVIDTQECLTSASGMLIVVTNSKQGTYHWDTRGDKVYDSIGRYLCRSLIYTLKQENQGKSDKQSKVQSF